MNNSQRRNAPNVMRRPAQEEAFASQEPPQAASEKETVQGWSPAQVGGGGIDGHTSELERKTDRVIGEKCENVRRKIQHHEMAGILFSHQPAGEEGEAGLHEEDQESRIKGPRKVGGESNVTHRIGEFHGERLFGCLSLKFVKFLLALFVGWRCFVGGFGDGKGVSPGIGRVALIAGGNAGRIRFRRCLGPDASRPYRKKARRQHEQDQALPLHVSHLAIGCSSSMLVCVQDTLS
jgi:hypothetical protein